MGALSCLNDVVVCLLSSFFLSFTAADQGSLNNQFLQVIDAYKKPKCHSPDSIDVER